VSADVVPLLLLHHDPSSNAILASRIPHRAPQEFVFPTAFSLCGVRYALVPSVGPFQLTFWDHLHLGSDVQSVVVGFSILLMRSYDEIIMKSSFCHASPRNLKRTVIDDEALLIEIILDGVSETAAADCCQAFGSAYYTDGSNVAWALTNWNHETQYGFSINSDNVSAAEW
jgi:hypothetical protein